MPERDREKERAPNPNTLLLERDRAPNPNPSCESTREIACCLLRNRRSELLIECRSRGGERFCGLLRRRKSESLTIECTRRGAKLAMASRLGGDYPFKVVMNGYSGHLSVVPLPSVCKETPYDKLPQLVLPPPFPPETPDSVLRDVENEYLTPSLDEDASDVAKCGKMWDFDWFGEGEKQLQPMLSQFAVVPVWEPPYRRGKKPGEDSGGSSIAEWIPDFEEVETEYANLKAQNSSSILRKPGAPEDFLRGSTNNRPFNPGGIDPPQSSSKVILEGALNGDWFREVLEAGPLQTVPPGFKHGIDFGSVEPFLQCKASKSVDDIAIPAVSKDSEKILSLSMDGGLLRFDELFKKAWEQSSESEESDDAEEGDLISKEASIVFSDGFEHGQTPAAQDMALEEALGDLKAAVLSATEDLRKQAKHQEVWAVMEGVEGIASNFLNLVPDMALTFPFELDTFQKEAIYHLERNESVFVAAHTSAGKTVVAEYAFALAAKHCTRAIYTSPIKTISNQKYRDFSEKFDVGLLTGDVSLRPEASCLIMTTEILRSMLYKGADIVRDIEWVIFDEVHYVNDIERGVVWEEVIIMLPPHVNLVLLSATVPNTFEFADWIGRTKHKKIYVTGTRRRPVPLEHCLYYGGELYKICDQQTFLPQGMKEAREAHNAKTTKIGTGSGPGQGGGGGGGQGRGGGRGGGGGSQGRGGGRGGGGGQKGPTSKQQARAVIQVAQRGNSGGWRSETSQWYSFVNRLLKKGLLPVVVFCFSKNRCDQSVDSLTAADLTSGSEKSAIRVFCDRAFSRLKGSDRRLPQVLRVEDLLKRGIGVHHAGLLPIVKEVVEMLFCRGVIKVLFSTETFAMGVNAPARTVAFHGLRKHDGKSFRQLLPGEYTQMAGRAGRRGLDKVGTVVVMCWDDIPEEGDLRRLLTGNPTKLESQFRLTYSMILNLLRVEDLKVEDMLKRSFAEFHAQRALPEQQRQLLEREGALSKMNVKIDCILGEPTIEEYYNVALEAEKLGDRIQEAVMQSRAAQQSLVPGRVVVVKTPIVPVPTLGVVVRGATGLNKTTVVVALHRAPIPTTAGKHAEKSAEPKASNSVAQEGYFITRKGNRDMDDDYMVTSGGKGKGRGVMKITLPHYGMVGGVGFVAMEVDSQGFLIMCKAKIRVDSVRLLEEASSAAFSSVIQQLLELEQEHPGQDPPALDAIKDLKLNNLEIVEQYRRRQSLLEVMAQNKCHRCPKLQEHYALMRNQQQLKERVKQLKYELSDAALQQMPDFQQRIEVLQHVGYIDTDLVVQLKGRVACEINSSDELIATECLFDNQLDHLSPAEAVALLSALVFQQKEASKPLLTPRLAEAKDRLHNTALRLGEVQASFGLPINPEDYASDTLKFGLVEVVYEWAKGTPFADICELTDVPEGSIVRTIVRLDETCRELRNAARIMGDSTLLKKMEDASNAIKRDIVFAASLYVSSSLPTV